MQRWPAPAAQPAGADSPGRGATARRTPPNPAAPAMLHRSNRHAPHRNNIHMLHCGKHPMLRRGNPLEVRRMDHVEVDGRMDLVEAGGLRIARVLHDFITEAAIPGTGVDPAAFW